MSEKQRISDLHADVRVPFQDRTRAEYIEPPNRHPNVGERGEHSVLARLHEFGITDDDIHSAGIDDMREMTEEQYETLLGRAVQEQFSLLFANAFDHWKEGSVEQQWGSIRKTAEMVKRWKSNWGLDLILRGDELTSERPSAVLTLEGLYLLEHLEKPSDEDVDRVLADIHAIGIRSVVLQYNEPTSLAQWNEGLTALGEYTVRGLLEKNMLVDLAHARPSTRTDILRLAEDTGHGQQILFSHGAPSAEVAQNPLNHPLEVERGLNDEEIKRIMKMGGIIGLSVTQPFTQNPECLARTFDRLSQFESGPQSLALGTDFGGIAPSFSVGMLSPAEVALKLGDALSERLHVSDAHVNAILRTNAQNWIRKNLN